MLAEIDPASADAAEARERRHQAEWIISGLSEPGFEVRTPDLSFSERMTLDLGNLSLELNPENGNAVTMLERLGVEP